MNEQISNRDHAAIRHTLLIGVSVMALMGYVSSANMARAEDASHPIVWIELDGQYSQLEDSASAFAPPFMTASPFDGISHLDLEKGPTISWDSGAKITFQPEGSEWYFMLAARYGKSSKNGVRDEHPPTTGLTKYSNNYYNAYQNFAAQRTESHTILDFQAGKDFGLGVLTSGGSSVFGAGVRIVQFNSRSNVTINSQPANIYGYAIHDKFHADFTARRKFSGIGPSISWDASAKLFGNPEAGRVTFDWGANGAVLFGRQQVAGHHQQIESGYGDYNGQFEHNNIYQHYTPLARSKNVVVPNLGGFAGVSWRYPNAKVSVGYRADFFLGAMDGGIDTAHRENVGFYGPFASVSIGIGG
jgi:hypothetical protein